MPETLKNILLVLAGAIGVILLISLIIAICCSVNGLKFGEQICEWFGSNAGPIAETVEEVAEAVAETPVV